MLGVNYDGDGTSIGSLSGEVGTFAEGLSFDYLPGATNGMIDDLSASGGDVIIKCEDNIVRMVSNSNSRGYKTITSSINFSSLRGVENKVALMKSILTFFDNATPIQKTFKVQNSNEKQNVYFGNSSLFINLKDLSKLELILYSFNGKKINQLYNNYLNAGNHVINLDQSLKDLSKGSYLIQINQNNNISNKSIIIKWVRLIELIITIYN